VPIRRWTFSIWRLLAAFVVVSACFALARPLGPQAAYGATVTAIALGAMALFGRWKDVNRGGLLAVGILGGGMFGSGCFGPVTEKSMLAGFVIGACVGAVFVLQLWRSHRKPNVIDYRIELAPFGRSC
jgi:hypothetical protein